MDGQEGDLSGDHIDYLTRCQEAESLISLFIEKRLIESYTPSEICAALAMMMCKVLSNYEGNIADQMLNRIKETAWLLRKDVRERIEKGEDL